MKILVLCVINSSRHRKCFVRGFIDVAYGCPSRQQSFRIKVPFSDLVLFYTTCVRSILTYAVPVFHHALPKYLKIELERIQKRALAIICPSIAYNDALYFLGIPEITTYNEAICDKMFDAMVKDSDNRLK